MWYSRRMPQCILQRTQLGHLTARRFSLIHGWRRIVGTLLEEAEQRGYYKITLNCYEANVGLYQKAGHILKGV